MCRTCDYAYVNIQIVTSILSKPKLCASLWQSVHRVQSGEADAAPQFEATGAKTLVGLASSPA